MPTDPNPKQLVVQRLKDATNILVTVSRNPSVDDLSAALALTLILDKIGKTPTAVFSGKIPPAIEFLEPGKTFDTNVDGLRDFIIALDKEKADRLRYKVEDDVVRVFITPYKTTITEKDLTFSQGDFNVDLIVAFGVEKREDLDAAITAHGRILHDAAIVTINQRTDAGSLGEIDWTDAEASSLSEMLMSLTESLQSGLLDQPIATAILTGLVSSTDRFRNEKTTPKVMTMAAQLMAAGANQQLIAQKLEEADTVSTGKLNEAAEGNSQAEQTTPEPKKASDGEMKVEHGEGLDGQMPLQNVPTKDAADQKAEEVASEESAEAVKEAKEELQEIADTQLPPVMNDVAAPEQTKSSSWRDAPMPSMGGTLNATTEEAEEENRKREEDTKNHVILSHDEPVLGEPANGTSVLNAISLPPAEPTVSDIFTEFPVQDTTPQPQQPAPVVIPPTVEAPVQQTVPVEPVLQFEETPLPTPTSPLAGQPIQSNPTLADLEQQVHQQEALAASEQQIVTPVDPLENARAAVDAALGAQPFNPAGQPLAAAGAQSLGQVDHPEAAPLQAVSAEQVAPALPVAPILDPSLTVSSLPPLPPLPDFSTLPPLPGAPTDTPTPSLPTFGLPEGPGTSTTPSVDPVSSGDPAQFKLPGQS